MANAVADGVLAWNVGDPVGMMIASGRISIADVISTIDSASHTFGSYLGPLGEFSMLTRAAHYLTPAQDRELGAGFGALLAGTNFVQQTLDLIDLRTNPGDILTVDQTTSLLRGMVVNGQTWLLAASPGVYAADLSGRLTAGAAIQSLDQEITAHTLTVDAVHSRTGLHDRRRSGPIC